MTRFTLPVCTLALAASLVTTVESRSQDPARKSDDPRIADLAVRALPLRTIDPADDDFRDLEPLAKKIGRARIVVLGEATHSEGSTFALKARLCRFLHRRLGFDVLAWEAGFIGCDVLNRSLRDRRIPLHEAKRHMMRGGWSALDETHSLFEYARASWATPWPLEMAGFDHEKPPLGAEHLSTVLHRLDDYLTTWNLNADDRSRLRAFGERAFAFIGRGPKTTAEERARQRALLTDALRALESKEARTRLPARQLAFYRTAIRRSLVAGEYKHRIENGPRQGLTRLRDRAMADTFRALAKEMYSGRRIIIWAATAHLTRNTTSLAPVEARYAKAYIDAEHMGDTVFRDFGDAVYTIAITSHHGKTGLVWPASAKRKPRVHPVPAPLAGSLEDVAHRVGKPLLFIDLRNEDKSHWLRQPLVARPLGFIPIRADWSRVVDAFLFIDEMAPQHLCERR